MMNPKINAYQKKCWNNYKSDLGIEDYSYCYGNPVKVHVPVDTAIEGVMIIGAYPTSHFNTIKSITKKSITNVPVADHLYPFSDESYFDGSSVRHVKSGKEITDFYLKPLKISREDCWVTDLVKVFLFKPGHVKKYEELKFKKPHILRKDFMKYARLSISYLEDEIKLAKPKVILLLGTEVIRAVLKVTDKKAKELMIPEPIKKVIENEEYVFFALPHPGIVSIDSLEGRNYKKILTEQLAYIRINYLTNPKE